MFSDLFLAQILLRAGFPDDERLEILVDETRPVYHDRVLTQLANHLNQRDPELLTQFKEKCETENEKILDDFLRRELPELDSILDQIHDEFEKIYLKNFEEFRDLPHDLPHDPQTPA